MPDPKRLLVTGANGFVGRAVCATALKAGWQVRAMTRRNVVSVHGVESVIVKDWHDEPGLAEAIKGCDAIVHCAARAHVMNDAAADPLSAFREANTYTTERLARLALRVGVQRFVFMSSIGVNGADSAEKPFTAGDKPHPHSPYAVSKLEAEAALHDLASESALEPVILRAPLVYGPDAPGNFGTLVRWSRRRIPLPLGAAHNLRTLVGLENLSDLILRCVTHPQAAGRIFLAGDGEDVSTTELLRMLSKASGANSWLVPVPAPWLKFGLRLMGKQDLAVKLLENLQVDISATCQTLDWSPPVSLGEGLRRAVQESGKSTL